MASIEQPDQPTQGPRHKPLFGPASNTIARFSIVGGILLLVALVTAGAKIYTSDYWQNTNVPVAQPVQFSHEHHVGGLGVSCQYCHSSVEVSSSAGIPPVQTCMTCHSQVWSDSPYLAPVRDSFKSGVPIQWNRVYNLPDYVFFNHSVHVNNGVGCSSCHGQVDQMPLMRQNQPLFMRWCLECHTAPEKQLRPKDEIYNMSWTPGPNQIAEGQQLIKDYKIDTTKLKNCSTCHR